MPASRPYTFDRVVRLVISLCIFAFAIWLINLLKDVLLPFCVACLIAYLFEPFVQYNRRLLHLKGRIIAIFVTLFEAMMFFGLLCYFCIPSVIEEMHQMARLLRDYANSDVSITYLPPQLHDVLKRNIDFEQMAQALTRQDIEGLFHKGMSVLSGGVHVVLSIVAWLIVFLYVIFIMLDYDKLMNGFRLMVPPRARPVAYKIGRDIKDSMNHYFRGQALIACVVAVIYCVGFLLCGLPLAVILGLGTAVLFMIPYCQYLSIIPVTLLCLVESAGEGGGFLDEMVGMHGGVRRCADCGRPYPHPQGHGQGHGTEPGHHPAVAVDMGHPLRPYRHDYRPAPDHPAAILLRTVYYNAQPRRAPFATAQGGRGAERDVGNTFCSRR